MSDLVGNPDDRFTKLMCTFVFAYAKSSFSHDVAKTILRSATELKNSDRNNKYRNDPNVSGQIGLRKQCRPRSDCS